MPAYRIYVPKLQEKKFSFNYGWTRPTIPWKLSCETEAKFSRQEAYKLFTEDKIDLGALDHSGVMLNYGVAILTFAILGPLLGCITLRFKQYRNRQWGHQHAVDMDQFLVWFGSGIVVGYVGLLIVSVLITKRVDDAVKKMNLNNESL